MRKILCFFAFLILTALPAAAQTQQPIRVNCGGPAYTDSKGLIWAADHDFNGGSEYSTSSPISGTSDQKLYQSERYGQSFVYAFPVANGNYSVNVLLAEIYPGAARVGARVMNIKVQGSLDFPNVDIFSLVGFDAALTKSTIAVVNNGTLTVEFDGLVQNAKCSAIEILPAPAGTPLTLLFRYPDGTPVSGTLAYTVTSSLLSFQGNTPLTNGQAQCLLFANPSALGISAQFQVSLSLTDTANHHLWQINLGMDPSTVNLGAIQSSTLNVTVQKL